jgi:hypothetical protein
MGKLAKVVKVSTNLATPVANFRGTESAKNGGGNGQNRGIVSNELAIFHLTIRVKC